MRRLRSAAILSVGLAVVLGGGLANAKPTVPPCRNAVGATVYQDKTLRVYTTSANVKRDPDAHTLRVFACVPGKRETHQLELFHNNLDGQLNPVAVVRGGTRWIVIDYAEETGTDAARDLWEYDLAKFKGVARTAVEGSDDPGVVVTRDGAFAFFDGLRLQAADTSSRRELEPPAGPTTVGATALAAGGDTVYWQAGGAVKSALLLGHPTGDLPEPGGA